MSRIFISHASENNEVAKRMSDYLKYDGADVWLDNSHLEGGDSLPKVISEAIAWCDTLILVWSKSANNSDWVNNEWGAAFSTKKRIIPCKLDDFPLPSLLASKLFLDFRDFDSGYRKLARTLKLNIKIKESQSPELKAKLDEEDVQKLLKKYNFFDARWNKKASGFKNQFVTQISNGEKVILDSNSGLMWQQSGSSKPILFLMTPDYIEDLNKKKFAGFEDWRLPLLGEAMSLVKPKKMSLLKPKKMNTDLFIDPVFEQIQETIVTAHLVLGYKISQWYASWVVDFTKGLCHSSEFKYPHFVRAVRFLNPNEIHALI